MKLQIKEFSKLCGVSVRTLHFYDEIGLLAPADVDEQNGYRFYNESSLERMQEILFYRELDFSLKTIAEILSSPNYNKQNAISKQKRLLTLKKERLERLINALEIAENGGNTMDLKQFDNSEYENTRKAYENEVKAKWGETAAYREFSEKSVSYSKEKWNEMNADMDSLIVEFAECMKARNAAESALAQALVKKWQEYLCANYFDCTKEILSGLGLMYTGDERFKNNIDKHGDGTAEFMSKSIEFFCK